MFASAVLIACSFVDDRFRRTIISRSSFGSFSSLAKKCVMFFFCDLPAESRKHLSLHLGIDYLTHIYSTTHNVYNPDLDSNKYKKWIHRQTTTDEALNEELCIGAIRVKQKTKK